MGLYDVLLGVDRAAVDTKRRMKIRVMAEDSLSAAIQAERLGDLRVAEPAVEYTHAVRVQAISEPRPATVALAA